MNGDYDHQNKKELVDRVKNLELQFQLHVSESKAEREDQYEKIVILKAAKKAQGEKLQHVLSEMDALKEQNRDQMTRIVQLEEILKTKKDAASSIQSVVRNPMSLMGKPFLLRVNKILNQMAII